MRRLLTGTALVSMLVLAGCGGNDDNAPTPTPVPTPIPTQATTGSVASDGICQVTIPDDWVNDGTGRGQTSLGDSWVVFGGAIASDDAWSRAIALVKSQVENQDATIDETDTSITVLQPAGRGYLY